MNRKMLYRQSFVKEFEKTHELDDYVTLSNEVAVESQSKYYHLGFLCAIELGDRPSFDRFLANGVNCRNRRDIAMVAACRYKQFDMAAVLLEQGCQLDCQDNRPLREAAELGLNESFEFLVENGVDVRVKNDFALARAARFQNDYITFRLFELGADISRLSEYMLKKLVTKPQEKIKNLNENSPEMLVDALVKSHCKRHRVNAGEEFSRAEDWLKPYYMRHLFQ